MNKFHFKFKDQTLNMTEGNPLKLILIFSIPMLVGNIFQQAYNLADAVIVGEYLGSDPFAAINATASITFFFFALCNGFGSGGGIITSQFFGEKNDKKIRNCIINVGYIMFVLPLLIGLLSFILAGPFLTAPVILAEEAQLLWKKEGYTDHKKHLVYTSPFLLAGLLLALILKAPNDPYSWNLVKKVYTYFKSGGSKLTQLLFYDKTDDFEDNLIDLKNHRRNK